MRSPHGGAIVEEPSWSSNHGGAVMEEKSSRRDHGGNIMEENSSGRSRGGDLDAETSKRHLGGLQWASRTSTGAPRRQPGLAEAPRGTQKPKVKKHPETPWRQPGDQSGRSCNMH